MNGTAAPLPDSFSMRATGVRWRILAILMAYSFLCHFNRVSMPVAGTERIMKPSPIDPVSMGAVYSAYLFVYTLFMTPGGWFIDRYGPWAALVFMGFGSALFGALTGTVCLGLVGTALLVPALLVVRGLMGLCSAPIHPGCARVISHWMPFRQRALANGMVTGAALVGIASTYWVFGRLMDALNSYWAMAFVISAGVTALVAVVWTVYGKDRPKGHASVNRAELELIAAGEPHPSRPTDPAENRELPWSTFFRHRSLMLLTASYAAVGYFEYLFFYWMQFYFEDQRGLPKEESRLYSSALSLAMAVGMPLGGLVTDWLQKLLGYRTGRAVVPAAGMVLGAVFLVPGVLAAEPAWAAIWFALALAAVGGTEGAFWATAIELGGRQGGITAGICNTGGNAGGILAPVLTPLVGKHYGWPPAMILGGILCLVGACFWFGIDPRQRVRDTPAKDGPAP